MADSFFKDIEGFYFSNNTARSQKNITRHYHDDYEIYFLKEGKCNYFIDDRSYEVTSGDVIFIPVGVIHKTQYTTPTRTRSLINCSAAYIPESVLAHIGELPYLYRNKAISKDAERIFDEIAQECHRADFFSSDALKCYTGELFLLLLRNENEFRDTGGTSIAARSAKYLRENYMSDVRLSEVAALCSVSPEHLSRTFKRDTGFGFNEYLTLLRLKKAEFMLKNEPGRSIAEVAYACGFNDSNYFSDKFKKVYGYSPRHAKQTPPDTLKQI